MKVQGGSEGVLELPDCCLPVGLEGSSPLAEGSGEGSRRVLGLAGDAEGPVCSAGLGSASAAGLCSSCSCWSSLVLIFSSEKPPPAGSGDRVYLETFATGDTDADDGSGGVRGSSSLLGARLGWARPPAAEAKCPAWRDSAGPGTRLAWVLGLACTIWMPPMGIMGYGVLASCCECSGRWLKTFSSPRPGAWRS